MEQKTQELLTEFFRHNNVCQDFIYYTPSENPILKKIFQNASKHDTGNAGRPDRIYFDEETLIVFECKSYDAEKCISDLHSYKNNITTEQCYENIKYYFCSVVGTDAGTLCIQFFDSNMNKIDFNSLKIKVKPKVFIYKGIPDAMKKFVQKFHNDIRNKTKLNDSHKPLFISSILICLSHSNFIDIIKSSFTDVNLSEIMISILKQHDIKNDGFHEQFVFLRTSLDNPTLFNFCKSVYDNVFSKNFGEDILNVFYSEFVKYQNTDSKSLGIVLTPDHIVSLMIDMLDIKPSDIFLDICSGSGSFPCKALQKNPKKIFAVEYQSSLYSLLRANMILRKVKTKAQIMHQNCFKLNFTKNNITKSAINPPYGMKYPETELDFVLHQLKNIQDGGRICAIIPIGVLNNSSSNNKKKQELMNIGKILSIIRCSNRLFFGQASVETCIILIEKCKNGHSGDTYLVDYRDDGMETKRCSGKVKTEEFEMKYKKTLYAISHGDNKISLSVETDWSDFPTLIPRYLNRHELELEKLERDHLLRKKELLKKIKDDLPDEQVKYKREKEFTFDDLFIISKVPSKNDVYTGQEISVPIVCASKINLGIKSYTTSDNKTFSGNKIVLVTGGDGGAGLAHYHPNPFNITSSTYVLTPKYPFLTQQSGSFVSKIISKYKKKYSHSFQWSKERIKKDTIILPVNDKGAIDFSELAFLLPLDD
jgi:16S rRNA G966 N2-methylase RsmD